MGVELSGTGGFEAAGSVLDHVGRMYACLSRAERQVADFLLADPARFARTSINGIASRSGVSAPTIIRFCRAAGYDGLTDLKFSVVSCLGSAGSATKARTGTDPGGALLQAAADRIAALRQPCGQREIVDAASLLARASSTMCMASCVVLQAGSYARDALLRRGMPALTPDSPDHAGAPSTVTSASAAGLFFCHGLPDAAMVDAITSYRKHGVGAIVVAERGIASFAKASVEILTGLSHHADDTCHGSLQLVPHLLMIDLLVDRAAYSRLQANYGVNHDANDNR